MKKQVSLLLAFLLCLSALMPMCVTAVAEPTVSVGTAAGHAGDTISVTVSLQNNPGIVALQLQVSYDNTKLQLTNAEDCGLLDPAAASFGNLRRVPFSITWDDSAASSDHTGNGAATVLTFLILDTAEPGNIPVNVSVVQAGTFNIDLDDVVFQTINGAVTVQSDFVPAAAVTVGSATARAGEDVDIPITISENPGMIAMLLSVNYDTDSIQLTGVTDGTVFGTGNASFGNDLTKVPYKLLWENGAAHSNYLQNGTLAILHFHVSESASEGSVEITLQYEQDSTFDVDLNNVPLSLCSGTLTIGPGEEPPVTAPSIDIGGVSTAAIGDTFTLPVTVRNNPGIIATIVSVSYDPNKLELIAADTSTEVFPNGSSLMTNDLSRMPFRLLFEDGAAYQNYTEDGVLAELTFLVKENAQLGDTQITLAVDTESTFDVDLNEVSFQVKNAVITITESNLIFAKAGTTAVAKDGFIYGLLPGLTSLEDYVTVKEGYTLSYDSSSVIGTGTLVSAVKNNQIDETCSVVIFGDVDGDGRYNGTDAFYVNLIVNGVIPASAFTDAQLMAADCNHDGAIDEQDVYLLEQAGILLAQVDQTLPQEELVTNSVYLEYCSLIDQSVEVADPSPEQHTADEAAEKPAQADDESAANTAEEPAAEHESNTSIRQIILDLFKRLVNFITMIFSITVLK